MNALTQPEHYAGTEDWARFLKPVAMAVRNTPTDDEFRARVAAVSHAVRIPAAWLRQPWRQAEAMRKCQFWPSVADICDLFAEALRAERESADRRERLSAPAPDDDGPRFRTPAEILAVQAKARALTVELTRARPDDRITSPVKPMPLSDGDLLRRYERQINDGATPEARQQAKIRVEWLRQRMGADA